VWATLDKHFDMCTTVLQHTINKHYIAVSVPAQFWQQQTQKHGHV